MDRRRYLSLVISLTLFVTLACGFPGIAPTVTPSASPEPSATPAAPATTPTALTEPSPTPAPVQTPTATLSPDDRAIRQNLLRATVQIVALTRQGGRFQPMWTGSGSVLSPEGLILTNAHVATDPDPDYQPDALGVAITVRSDDLPELKYLAEVRAIDYNLDLAVIQIVSDLSGDAVDTTQLGLPYVTLGDSDKLELGDLLHILGYPGIGGETITFTEGVVSGFTREPGVDGRAYVKTDATIAGGNSGGLAANLSGEIVGVPTQVGYGGAERFADCRYLADTNGDGRIDSNDNCIPVGGFINAIRPVNLAKPLVEAARLGIASPPTEPKPKSGGTTPVDGSFFNLVFTPDVNDNDQPTQIVTQLPSGATELYACWEYTGMADGATWEARWSLDGEYQEDVSWAPAPWKGGVSGSWWVSVYNEDGLYEGTYQLELYVEGELLAEGTIQVGGAVSGPAITNLIFAEGVTGNDQPVNPSYLLSSGITEVYAFFDYAGIADGTRWQRVWFYEGEEVASKEAKWDGGSYGSTWVGLTSDDPLEPGDYRLEIYIEGVLAATSSFSVAGTKGRSPIGPITFAAGEDRQGNPVNPGTVFESGLTELRYFVDYVGMRDGMAFQAIWYFDGDELLTVDLTWEEGSSGTFSDNIYRKSGDSLWDGEYRLEIYLEGQLVQEATATIGGGAPPPTPLGKNDG